MDSNTINQEFHQRKLEETFESIFRGIDACLIAKCPLPALILVYSAIDSLAFLSMPATQDYVGRKNFMDWVEKYLQPETCLGCSVEDLWSARCGVIHTLTPESRMTQAGNAKRVFYAWGLQQPIEPGLLDKKLPNTVMIKIEDLIEAFRDAATAFFSEADKDEALNARASQRITKMFINLTINDINS